VNKKKKLQGFSLQSELYQPSDRCLSAKLVPTLADRGCRVVSTMKEDVKAALIYFTACEVCHYAALRF
jgi:hypothetical protein